MEHYLIKSISALLSILVFLSLTYDCLPRLHEVDSSLELDRESYRILDA